MQNLLNSIVFKVLILTVIGTLGAAVMVTGVKFLSDDLHPFVIAFFRCLSGLIILFPFIIKDNFKTLKTMHFKTHMLRSFFNCISMLTWFSAIGLMHLEKAAALGFTTPLFATILAVIILKEVIKIHRTIAVIMGFIGILIIIRPGYITVDSGTYLMIIASISWAFVLIIIKQLSKTDSNLTIIFYMLFFMTPITFILAFPFWETPSTKQIIIFLCMGLGGLLSHLCLVQTLKIADTTLVMPFQYLKLIWASLIGYLLFFEKPDVWTWIGGTIVFVAVIYITYRESIYKKIKNKKLIIRPHLET
tara:strand:+ start:1331 stop:2242 length:912 start_codon:yes stop_codon:yes gene_type:complete